VDASLLLTLTDRVATLAAPSAVHAQVRAIGTRVDSWAVARGLVLGDPDATPLGRARFERLASRMFPTADPDRVTLFGRWLVWLCALDDAIDDAPLGGSATAVHRLYTDLLGALRRGHARPEARPLETALAELWAETVPGMSRDWRRRFLLHLEEHRAGCIQEAVNRRTGRRPELADFAPLRRRAAGPFLYDLAEPVLGVELPPGLLGTQAWKALLEGTADMIAWSNDVVSYRKEHARGGGPDPVLDNHVAAVCTSYRFEPERAAHWVIEHIAQRAPDVGTAARALGADLDRLGAGPRRRRDAAAVVRTLVDAPRAHLDWLAETGRYTEPGREASAPLPAAPPRPRLSALASLR
jgi:terpene synthase-like protein